MGRDVPSESALVDQVVHDGERQVFDEPLPGVCRQNGTSSRLGGLQMQLPCVEDIRLRVRCGQTARAYRLGTRTLLLDENRETAGGQIDKMPYSRQRGSPAQQVDGLDSHRRQRVVCTRSSGQHPVEKREILARLVNNPP
ncbi:hypothetical protein AQJ67_03180 [Streptomyces caeruleatus]|uniref:Uncharacterized protein n=1 Tax=Streptomyces caeruleatus TaxID=661399 RepID=A0A117RRW4_9ACTN|nr:hypothetical protein AQJ67_03180 [Streptomyces caeruleatus]